MENKKNNSSNSLDFGQWPQTKKHGLSGRISYIDVNCLQRKVACLKSGHQFTGVSQLAFKLFLLYIFSIKVKLSFLQIAFPVSTSLEMAVTRNASEKFIWKLNPWLTKKPYFSTFFGTFDAANLETFLSHSHPREIVESTKFFFSSTGGS